ncbi:MAG: SDR family oxidoreductase [Bradymonadaceae bacterium]
MSLIGTVGLIGWIKGTGPNGFGWASTAEEVTEGLDLSDKRMLITGCNSGIGKETMRVLAMRGATVFGAARTQQKAERTCESVEGDTRPVVCELSEPDSVRSCADEVASSEGSLDAIICNAGIMALPDLEQVHGYEKQFFVNHIGHFILVTELLEQLADDGRVVMLTSDAHNRAPEAGIEFDNLSGEDHYSDWTAYGQSKLANLLFARELGRRFEEDETDRTANAVHPGVINTNLARHLHPFLQGVMKVIEPVAFKSPEQGAATQTYVAAHPDAADHNGEYFADCNPEKSSEAGRDRELAERLWKESERIVDEVST